LIIKTIVSPFKILTNTEVSFHDFLFPLPPPSELTTQIVKKTAAARPIHTLKRSI